MKNRTSVKIPYDQRQKLPITATHDRHIPKVFFCPKCNPRYQRPVQPDDGQLDEETLELAEA
jgi:hypothetical protein